MAQTELAWAGGFFEGEGCISRHARNDRASNRGWIVLTVSSTDLDPLQRFWAAVDEGNITGPKDYGFKPLWRWQTAKQDAVLNVLSKLWPYLGIRRQAKALEVLEEWASIPTRPYSKVKVSP